MDTTYCQLFSVPPDNAPSPTTGRQSQSPLPGLLVSSRKITGGETHVSVSSVDFQIHQLQQVFICIVTCPGWEKFKVPMAVTIALPQDKVGAEGSKLSSSAGWNLCLLGSKVLKSTRSWRHLRGWATSLLSRCWPSQHGHIWVTSVSLDTSGTKVTPERLPLDFGTVWLHICKCYYMQVTLFTLWKWA